MLPVRVVLLAAILVGATAQQLFTFDPSRGEPTDYSEVVSLENGDPQSTGEPARAAELDVPVMRWNSWLYSGYRRHTCMEIIQATSLLFQTHKLTFELERFRRVFVVGATRECFHVPQTIPVSV